MSNIKNYNRYSPNYSPYSAEMPARQPAAYGYKAAAKQPDAQEPTALYLPKTTWTWAFFITAVIQAVISLSLECYVFAQFQIDLVDGARRNPASKTIPTYLSVFIFGFLYELYLVWDALRLRNTIQVIGVCFFNIGILSYAAIQTNQIKSAVAALVGQNQMRDTFWQDVRPFLVAVPCVIGLFTLIMAFIARKLYGEFAWTIYKHISADLRMKRRYLAYQIYVALLKFDFYFFLGFTIQFLVVVPRTSDAEFYLTIAAIPVTVGLLFLGAFWTRRENVVGMVFTILFYFAALGYFLFKMVRMYASDVRRVEDYRPVRPNLTTFAVITILLLVLTIVNACWCTSNFDKGLKNHILGRSNSVRGDKKSVQQSEMPALSGQVPSRMEID